MLFSSTEFLGPLQGIFVCESIIEHIASFLGKENSDAIKEQNFYENGQVFVSN